MNRQSKSVGGYNSFPVDWDVVPLAKVAFFQEGPGLRKWQWTDFGMKVINVTNIIGDGQIDTENTRRFISMEEFTKTYSHFSVGDGDIVIASSGNTYGKTGRISAKDLPLMMNTSVIRFHSGNALLLSDDFLYAFVRSEFFRNQVESFVTGSAQPNFGPSHLKQMVMPLPPLRTQRCIASILSAYDELIENNQHRIRILEEMARSLYREWFVNFRYPGHDSVPLVDSSLGQVPQGWTCGRLDEVLVLQRGFDLPKGEREAGTVPIIAATGINGFHSVAKVKAPGVITGRSGSLGTVLYVHENFWPLNTALWVKEFPKSEPLFAYYLLSSLELKQFNSGAAVPTLNRNDVHRVQVVIPPRELQRRFQLKAGVMLEQAENLQRQSANLRSTRDLLLPRLMSGNLNLFSKEAER